jgi:hypothetical protein
MGQYIAEWEGTAKVLKEWLIRAQSARNGHGVAAQHYARWHWGIGSAIVCLSAGSAAALALGAHEVPGGRWILVVMSSSSALLAAFQMFRKAEVAAQRHETARTGFASVCRDIEQVLALPVTTRGNPEAVMSRLRGRLDDLAALNAKIPQHLWRRSAANG